MIATHFRHRSLLVIFVALISISIDSTVGAAAPSAPLYWLTDIVTLFGTSMDVRAINNQGAVAGIAYNPGLGSRGSSNRINRQSHHDGNQCGGD